MTHTQIGKPYHVCNRFLYVEDRLAPGDNLWHTIAVAEQFIS